MRSNFYTYCALKYQHSSFLDESLNIGVLIYFHDSQEFSFTYSKTLNRVKSIYNNVPEKTIKEYIRQIDRKLKHFKNLKSDIFPLGGVTEFSDFVYKNILTYDASCLKFDGFKTQSQSDFSDDFIEKTIINKLFIEDLKSNSHQQQEPRLISHLRNELKNSGFDSLANKNRYQTDYTINTTTGKFNFDFAWKNGVWNLVKPVGFDLKTSEGIIQKARNNLGEFTDLYSEVKSTEYKSNIIVGRPTDKALFKTYDNALSILHKLPNTEIVEENKLKQYSEKIIEAVSKDM